ncbi:malto-oligosyltrehalose trehalohydrolase [Halochromatium salexigens]|uniref:Malto-oligosyltrehalose trehalohydrolase n=2 Tax=Halochromatium salexigens TaxID=49447 RepID=A0AAJ0XE57_HALSE|nr:malto-oligosyltrehalose trehalohydrolase [Halochromatium salexigens]
MPFGTAIAADGSVSFRLWAPAARHVELLWSAGPAQAEQAFSVHRANEGWHHLTLAQARAGDRYRYRIDEGLAVPDPASRFQPEDVHGPSQLIDPLAFDWGAAEAAWRGRPWHEAVLYELHVGTFSASGDYAGVERRLDHLLELGVTALELMPLADFPGQRNWGYDGALLYAPDACYGPPDALKRLIRAAHERGLMVLLDVVYNHFGPEGNYLHCYAPAFFHPDRHTPWGAAINLDGPQAQWVRAFFIQNALYWLEEYRFDGLRLDAVDRLIDTSQPDLLDELAARVQAGPGRERQIHLILENDHNDARRYERDSAGQPRHFTAQWNDDLHHALHHLLTGETDGPYQDFVSDSGTSADPSPEDLTTDLIARALTEGFAYQGEPSAFREGHRRGTASAHLPPAAMVNFLQNHDQAGNRAFGERLHQLIPREALDAAFALLLLAPSPPLLFMGEEFDAERPFLFFCDFGPELADAVREGRRREFARSAAFADPASRATIPDPNAPETFNRSCLDWRWLDHLVNPSIHAERPDGSQQRRFRACQRWLALRRARIAPLIPLILQGGEAVVFGRGRLSASWDTSDHYRLRLMANLNAEPAELPSTLEPPRRSALILDHRPDPESGTQPTTAAATMGKRQLAPWSVQWSIEAYRRTKCATSPSNQSPSDAMGQ